MCTMQHMPLPQSVWHDPCSTPQALLLKIQPTIVVMRLGIAATAVDKVIAPL